MDLISELGPLAFGSRLKRLSDMVMKGGQEVYRHYGVDFEPKWFTLFISSFKGKKQVLWKSRRI
ncbi:hypothetical protein ACFFJX_18555 [Pseudarcicella hirudinis]|uniref:hypothetical protein n=1 Tax=Pseudarcicella hirudinis TaxID=1079859 RepID=UPI0035F0E3B8